MRLFVLFAALIAAPASAEVVSSSDHGFEVRQAVQIVVPGDAAFSAFANVSGWWDGEHSYSGDPANLSLSPQAGACFCERIPGGGGIEHLHVAYVDPGKRMVLTGSLGPLLYEAVAGVMDVKFERIAGGTRVTLDYKAAGFANGRASELAPQVDQVLGAQLKRFRAFASSRR